MCAEAHTVDGSRLGLAANQRCQLAARPFTVEGCTVELGMYQLNVRGVKVTSVSVRLVTLKSAFG